MRELDFLHIFSTFAVGGPQRRFAILANAMPKMRHRILAMDGCYDATSLLDPSVSYEISDLPRIHNKAVSFRKIAALHTLLTSQKPDILCSYNWGSIESVIAYRLLSGKDRKPAHIHFEDGFGPDESPLRQLRRRTLTRRILLHNTPIILPSRTLEDVALRRWHLKDKNIVYIPNGVDLELYTRDKSEQSKDEFRHYQAIRSGLTIGAVGMIRSEKNLPLMLKVFEAVIERKIPANLSVIGHGPEFEIVTAHAKSSPAVQNISLLGYQENPEKFYKDFDIFLITSDTEQMPLSVLEAMASGLPVVATDVGDISHMLSAENTPFICPKGDLAALTKAIETLARDSSLRASVGKANRHRAEKNFSQDKMIKNFEKYFLKLVS